MRDKQLLLPGVVTCRTCHNRRPHFSWQYCSACQPELVLMSRISECNSLGLYSRIPELQKQLKEMTGSFGDTFIKMKGVSR